MSTEVNPKRVELPAEVIELLKAEAAATREIQRLTASIKSWEKYRKGRREAIQKFLGTAEVGTVNGEEVVSATPKAQFNGTEFTRQYEELAREFTRVKATEYIDWELLAAEYPDIVRKFQVVTFTNRTDS